MADTAYDAQLGYPFSFTFTPSSGTAFGSAQAQVEEANPPATEREVTKYRVISGANAGTEQFITNAVLVKEFKIKCTYSQNEQAAAMAAWAANKKGVLVCTYADGSTQTYGSGNGTSVTAVGGQTLAAITNIEQGPVNASGLREDTITITTPMPAVFVVGA